MSEIPSKNYILPGLEVLPKEANPWLVANKYYYDCLERVFETFQTKAEILKELSREDINLTCKKELGYLRQLAPDMKYKEFLGTQNLLLKNPLLDEWGVKSKK